MERHLLAVGPSPQGALGHLHKACVAQDGGRLGRTVDPGYAESPYAGVHARCDGRFTGGRRRLPPYAPKGQVVRCQSAR